MPLSLDQLIHAARLEPRQADSYGPEVAIRCYAEVRSVQLDAETARLLGTQYGLEGTLWCNTTTAPPGSKVALDAHPGLTGYVGAVTPYDDGYGLDHLKVELTPQPPAATQRTATVSLLGDGGSTWNPENRRTDIGPGAPYITGLTARISTTGATRELLQQVAEESITDTPYLVTLDRDQAPAQGEYVRVDTCPADPTLEDRVLRIHHVTRGTQRLERSLVCSLLAI